MVRFISDFFFVSSRRRHTRSYGDWSSDVCSSDLTPEAISCSAKHSAPVPSTILIASGAMRPSPWAWAIGTSDSRMASAEASEIPAVVRPFRKPRREIERDRYRATSSLMASLLRCAALFRCRRRLPPVCRGQVVGHGPDFVLGPQGAASDHAVEHALPASAVLPVILPHRRGVALKAFADEHFLSRRVGEPGRLGALRLRRWCEEQAEEENRERGLTGKGHGDCLLSLPATISRASRKCQSRLACAARLCLPAAASGTSWIPIQSARGAPGA